MMMLRAPCASRKRNGLHTGHVSLDAIADRIRQAVRIAHKLDELRQRREATMRTETGRDLVPVKTAVIDDELAKLGLRFKTRRGGRGKYVLRDAYDAGHEAGDRFEYRPGITEKPTAAAASA